MLKTSFYPDAYKFINTREDFEKYTELIDNAINLSTIFVFITIEQPKLIRNIRV